ncbi:hypothetical protein ACP4OV_022413 [Aristida adscensionis]
MQHKEATMSCGEVKPGRSTSKSWALRQLNVGFAGGVLLVLVTYLVVTQRFAISAPYVVISEARRITDKQTIKVPPETTEKEAKVVCSEEGRFSKTCEVDGDVRINGTAGSVVVVAASSSERREWKAWPYSRRGIGNAKEITVTQLPAGPAAAAPPPCTVTYAMPAVVFALGGHTGNYWHDYTDVLIPLFVASRRYDGEVQLLVASMAERPKWLAKYGALVRRLSRYAAVDLDGDAAVRCFPRVTVGTRIDKEFSVVPERVPGGRRLAMADFTAFLREAYALPRHSPAREPGRRPRLLLIHRGHYRRLLNEAEVVRAAEAVGFEAAAVELRGDAAEGEQARAVNSFDVLVGVHGAGLTNAVFLPPGAAVIQVVPYGKMEFVARAEFLEPAADMGLRYLDYSVAAEESSLLEELGAEHPAIRDPLSVHRSGWLEVFEIYLRKQDVRINVTRFAPMLWQALDHLRQQQQQH